MAKKPEPQAKVNITHILARVTGVKAPEVWSAENLAELRKYVFDNKKDPTLRLRAAIMYIEQVEKF